MAKLPHVDRTRGLTHLGKKLLGSVRILGRAALTLGIMQAAIPANASTPKVEPTTAVMSAKQGPASLVFQAPDVASAQTPNAQHASHFSHSSHSSHYSHSSHHSSSF